VSWSYEEALRWLRGHIDYEKLATGGGGVKAPTLDRMRTLCDLLGDPQHAQPVVHITGTNGKGSTARLIVRLLAAHNLSVGSYTSPDLGKVNERIARNLEPIGDDELAALLAVLADLERHVGMEASYFELVEGAAFRWFADEAVDAAVVEVGMGGRFDGTNVVDGVVAVVTNVGTDHHEVIGPTRTDIAREKAGIIRSEATLVLGETDPELLPVFEAEGPAALWLRNRDFGCTANQVAVGGRLLDLTTPSTKYDDVYLSLHGAHQGDNAAAALAAAEAFFDRPLDDEVVREAFADVSSPGRFEVVGRSPLVLLDGAHNVDGARAAAATLDDFGVQGERILVVGVLRGHEPGQILAALQATKARIVIACQADWPRALPAEEVADAARQLGVDAEIVADVRSAVARARSLATDDDAVLVTGSLYVVGEARRQPQ
jgi:dihydrofolate synthase / folylpolyglutamate synthase